MNKLIFFLIVVTITVGGCRNNQKAASTATGDTKFQNIAEDFLTGGLAWRPETAVWYGFHEFDGKISNLSKESIENELARQKYFDKVLKDFDTASISPETYYDFRIIRSAIKSTIFQFEERESYTKNPMTYAGALDVSIYIKRNFAPIEDRLKSVINIENEAPVFFSVARANLADSLAKPYLETAIQIAQGTVDFLEKDLILALKDVKNDSLMAVFKTANEKAIKEVKEFVDYLEKEKLPKAHNNYALGREKYQKMLLYEEGISMSPEKILEIGLSELEREKDIFNATAKIINPNKKPIEVYKDLQKEHPASDSLISDIAKNVEAIRQFIINKKIVTIPSDARVQVKETPKYARSIGMASMDSPGPFEKTATEAYYYITPTEPTWTSEQKEDWLAMFDYYTTDDITIHEVYPGHFIQFEHLKASPATKIEKVFGSYAFIEGWAHYTEKMMIDEGFGNTGDPINAAKYHLAQSGEALVRLCRLCVSIKMHCDGMSVDDATKFFMDNWYHGEKPSRQEAIRGTFDPEYLYYSLGKLMMLKLRKDYQQQEGINFSLQKFHDQVLDNGMPQIQILREKLLKDNTIWTQIL